MEKNVPDHPGAELPRDLARLVQLCDEPHVRGQKLAEVERDLVLEAQRDLQISDRARGLRIMDRKLALPLGSLSIGRLYDPQLATIAIDTYGLAKGDALLAVAAQRRRAAGEPSCNVVFMPSAMNCGRFVPDEQDASRLEITHGVMADEQGRAASGQLTHVVHADVVKTSNSCFWRQCQEAGVRSVDDLNLAKPYDNKANEGIPSIPDVRLPRRVTLDAMWRDAGKGEYVIKPAAGSRGRSVRIFSDSGQLAEACAHYHFLKTHDCAPVIEERVRSWPLFQPGDKEQTGDTRFVPGERLDWNVRAIIAEGKVAGMYVRADAWGKPVNKSTGAAAILLEELADYTDDPQVAAMIVRKINTAASAVVAAVPCGIGGADITIDETGQAYLFEVNIGRAGGLQTIAGREHGIDKKLAAYNRLLDIWIESYGLHPKVTPDPQRQARTYAAHGRAVEYGGMQQPGQKIRRDLEGGLAGDLQKCFWQTVGANNAVAGRRRLRQVSMAH